MLKQAGGPTLHTPHTINKANVAVSGWMGPLTQSKQCFNSATEPLRSHFCAAFNWD